MCRKIPQYQRVFSARNTSLASLAGFYFLPTFDIHIRRFGATHESGIRIEGGVETKERTSRALRRARFWLSQDCADIIVGDRALRLKRSETCIQSMRSMDYDNKKAVPNEERCIGSHTVTSVRRFHRKKLCVAFSHVAPCPAAVGASISPAQACTCCTAACSAAELLVFVSKRKTRSHLGQIAAGENAAKNSRLSLLHDRMDQLSWA